MTRLSIRHETVYTYETPVSFGPWRLMMRPTDSHALRLVEARLELTPPGVTEWSYDAYGNSVCVFRPQGESNVLKVVNHLLIETYPNPLVPPPRDDPASKMPIRYEDDDFAVLQPFTKPVESGENPDWENWLRAYIHAGDELALHMLQRMTADIKARFQYGARNEEGTQTPAETFARSSGTCRDFAWLMIESVRRLGFAARFVTGYLYSPNAANKGAGATHAWCDVFLPHLGWLEFDPTNGLAESQDLIRVAATRTPQEASPMNGQVLSAANAHMEVRVDVRPAQGLAL